MVLWFTDAEPVGRTSPDVRMAGTAASLVVSSTLTSALRTTGDRRMREAHRCSPGRGRRRCQGATAAKLALTHALRRLCVQLSLVGRLAGQLQDTFEIDSG